MDKTNLPPLPPSVDSVWAEWRGERELLPARDTYYTADQMREYAARAVREAGAGAYAQGWMEAAHWTERSDLFCDMDSPAYNEARDSRLRKIGLAAPTQDQENGS